MKKKSVKLFIAGTDTEIGKTYISSGLLRAFNQLGLTTLGIKPIASGCYRLNNQIFNSDTDALQQASSIKLSHQEITPFAFEPGIAPHIAAKQIHCELNIQRLKQKLFFAFEQDANVFVIEGCGGWHTPLNSNETMSDFVIEQQYKIILVVGIKLGCINHALLTYQAMRHSDALVIGWIANHVDEDMPFANENVEYLKQQLPVPCLGVVSHHADVKEFVDAKFILEL